LLRDDSHAVAVVLRPDRAHPRIAHLMSRVEAIPGDLARCETLAASLRRFAPEAVVHMAWAASAANNRDSTDQADHVTHTANIIMLARDAGASHFIGMGSQAEYGMAADRNRTQDPGKPTSLYGTAKLCAGLLAERLCGVLGLRFAWLRLFSTYGPGEDLTWLIPSMCAKLLARERPAVTLGDQICDYLFIDDVAEAVHSVTVHARAEGFFDLGSGRGRTVREIIERVRDLIDPALPIGFGEIPYATNQVMRMEANVERLEQMTEWHPRIDLGTGLQRTVEWCRRQR
jgi:nucleoside-diphosphate-sugar epimerase